MAVPIQLPSTAEDDYVVYSGKESIIVMTSRDGGFTMDSKFKFVESACFIYAESVYISDEHISLPGKTLGIFCNSLYLQSSRVCIDVSGTHGMSGNSEKDLDGENGKRGGSVFLYVENMGSEVERLKINASGGDGGQGFDQRSAVAGGNGGDGGNPGISESSFTYSEVA
jgi:hypothetical protein